MADLDAKINPLMAGPVTDADRIADAGGKVMMTEAERATVATALQPGDPGVPLLVTDFRANKGFPKPIAELLSDTSSAQRIRTSMFTGTPMGLLVERARANRCFRTDWVGANAGTGALPTWLFRPFGSEGHGLSVTTTALDGEVLEVTLAGTPNATAQSFLLPGPDDTACVGGEDWALGFDLQVVSMSGVAGLDLAVIERDAGSGLAFTYYPIDHPQSDAPFPVWRRHTVAGGITRIAHALTASITAGTPVNLVLRLARPHRDKGRYPPQAFIANLTTAVANRAADNIDLDGVNIDVFDAAPWAVDIGFQVDGQRTGGLFELAGDGVLRRLSVSMAAGVLGISGTEDGDPVIDAQIGRVLSRVNNVLRLTYDGAILTASINGASPKAVPVAFEGGFTEQRLGRSAGGHLDGVITRLAAWQTVFPAPVAREIAFDNFTGPDGPLVTMGTGEPWQCRRRDSAPTQVFSTRAALYASTVFQSPVLTVAAVSGDPTGAYNGLYGRTADGDGSGSNGWGGPIAYPWWPASLVPMQVINGEAVTPLSGAGQSVSYTGTEIGSADGVFMAAVKWGAGAETGATLIANANGLTRVDQITGVGRAKGSVHVTFTQSKVDMFAFGAEQVTTGPTVNFARPVAANIYADLGWRLDGNVLTAFLPDETMERHVSDDYADNSGPYRIFEAFMWPNDHSSAGAEIRFGAVALAAGRPS